MNFKPILDRVLVRRAESETKTASGFFIPESNVEQANKGTVLAIGPGKPTKDGVLIPVADIAVDDMIMFAPGAGIPVKINGESLLILKEEEIIAVVAE
jgi:chaperonin GroES